MIDLPPLPTDDVRATARRELDELLACMRRAAAHHTAPHASAYGWLAAAVRHYLDGQASRAELARDLSTCETALLLASQPPSPLVSAPPEAPC